MSHVILAYGTILEETEKVAKIITQEFLEQLRRETKVRFRFIEGSKGSPSFIYIDRLSIDASYNDRGVRVPVENLLRSLNKDYLKARDLLITKLGELGVSNPPENPFDWYLFTYPIDV